MYVYQLARVPYDYYFYTVKYREYNHCLHFYTNTYSNFSDSLRIFHFITNQGTIHFGILLIRIPTPYFQYLRNMRLQVIDYNFNDLTIIIAGTFEFSSTTVDAVVLIYFKPQIINIVKNLNLRTRNLWFYIYRNVTITKISIIIYAKLFE